MGFGILFSGYFLLLNLVYFSFTDAISGIIMLYAFYKLSSVNREFKISAILASVFTAFGIFELFAELLSMLSFIRPQGELFTSVTAIVRAVILCALTLYMLRGMHSIAKEVGLSELSSICGRLYILAFPIYGVKVILEFFGIINTPEYLTFPLAVMTVLSLVMSMTLTVLILIRIYGCYMRICMPEDKELDGKQKEGCGFFAEFRKRQEEKQREYAEYKLEKYKKKMEKKKGKGKK